MEDGANGPLAWGCVSPRCPPIGMESHRIEDNQIRASLHAAPWPGVHSEAGSTCTQVGVRMEPISPLRRGPCPAQPPCSPDRPRRR